MKKLLIALTMLCIIALIVGSVKAGSEGSSNGTVTVTSAVPTLSSVELWDSAEVTDKNNTALDSNNVEYHLNFTVSDSNTMKDLRNVTIIAWDNRGQIEADSDSQRYHYTWTYVNSTDTWSCPLSANYITTGNCADASGSLTSTSYEFRLAFKLSKVANYSNAGTYNGWQVKIYVYDEANNTATFGQGTGGRIQFGVASYLYICVTDTTHTFSAAPNSTDTAVSAGGDSKVDFTVIANRVWKAQVKSNSATVNKTVDIKFNIGNITQYGSDAVGSSDPLTTEYADVTGITSQAAPTDEASPSSKGVYLWVDIPNGQESGDYTYTLYIQIAAG